MGNSYATFARTTIQVVMVASFTYAMTKVLKATFYTDKTK